MSTIETQSNFNGETFRVGKKELADALVRSPVGRIGVRLVIPVAAEVGVRSMTVEKQGLQNVTRLRELLTKDKKLIVLFNHEGLGDIAPIVRVARIIRKVCPDLISGFDLVVATSLQNGRQGTMSDVLYAEGGRPWFEKQGICAIDVVSDNDEKKRGIQRSMDLLMPLVVTLKDCTRGLIMLPEGNMDGGRRNERGELNGIGEMSKRTRAFVDHIVNRKDAVILLVGIHGTSRIFHPDTGNFTKDGVRAIIFNYLGITNESFGDVNIGVPFMASELRGAENRGREIMRRISLLVPEEARGIFRRDGFIASRT